MYTSRNISKFLISRLGEKEAEEVMDYIIIEIDKEVAEKVDAIDNKKFHKDFIQNNI